MARGSNPNAAAPLPTRGLTCANSQSSYPYLPAVSPHCPSQCGYFTAQAVPLAAPSFRSPTTVCLQSHHDTNIRSRRPYTPVGQPQCYTTTRNRNDYDEYAPPANHVRTTYSYPPAEHVVKKMFVADHSAQPGSAFEKSLHGHKKCYNTAAPQSSQYRSMPATPVISTKNSSSQVQGKHGAPTCERPEPVQSRNTAYSSPLAKYGVAMEFVPKNSVNRAKMSESSLFARNDMSIFPQSCPLERTPLSEFRH